MHPPTQKFHNDHNLKDQIQQVEVDAEEVKVSEVEVPIAKAPVELECEDAIEKDTQMSPLNMSPNSGNELPVSPLEDGPDVEEFYVEEFFNPQKIEEVEEFT